ncbi:hypothetical protein HK101_010762 [Irineochytrium annulatum]|nr:hypothetical protein HK101_010762 [Irineochytrium annulatum]
MATDPPHLSLESLFESLAFDFSQSMMADMAWSGIPTDPRPIDVLSEMRERSGGHTADPGASTASTENRPSTTTAPTTADHPPSRPRVRALWSDLKRTPYHLPAPLDDLSHRRILHHKGLENLCRHACFVVSKLEDLHVRCLLHWKAHAETPEDADHNAEHGHREDGDGIDGGRDSITGKPWAGRSRANSSQFERSANGAPMARRATMAEPLSSHSRFFEIGTPSKHRARGPGLPGAAVEEEPVADPFFEDLPLVPPRGPPARFEIALVSSDILPETGDRLCAMLAKALLKANPERVSSHRNPILKPDQVTILGVKVKPDWEDDPDVGLTRKRLVNLFKTESVLVPELRTEPSTGDCHISQDMIWRHPDLGLQDCKSAFGGETLRKVLERYCMLMGASQQFAHRSVRMVLAEGVPPQTR